MQSDQRTEADRFRRVDYIECDVVGMGGNNPGMVSGSDVWAVLRDGNVWIRES